MQGSPDDRLYNVQADHIVTLKAYLRDKDAEIARLHSLNRGNTSSASSALSALSAPSVSGSKAIGTTSNTAVPLPVPVPVPVPGPVPALVPWDEENDPLMSYLQVLRHNYGLLSALTPSTKRIVVSAVERYLMQKTGRVLYNSKRSLAVPTSLHTDFIEWFGKELDKGLLDPPPHPDERSVRTSKRASMDEEVVLVDGIISAQPVVPRKKRTRRRLGTILDDIHENDVKPDDFDEWIPWSWIVRDKAPHIEEHQTCNSTFAKLFCEENKIPYFQIRGNKNIPTRAIPKQFQNDFVAFLLLKHKLSPAAQGESDLMNAITTISSRSSSVECEPGLRQSQLNDPGPQQTHRDSCQPQSNATQSNTASLHLFNQSQSQSVSEKTPLLSKPVSDKTPLLSKPVSDKTPLLSKPVSDKNPLLSKPVSDKNPLHLKPVSDKTPLHLKSVSEKTPLHLKSVSEKTPLHSKPVSKNTQQVQSHQPQSRPMQMMHRAQSKQDVGSASALTPPVVKRRILGNDTPKRASSTPTTTPTFPASVATPTGATATVATATTTDILLAHLRRLTSQ